MKIPECDHDFEECEISNPYNYDFDEFKPCDSNQVSIRIIVKSAEYLS